MSGIAGGGASSLEEIASNTTPIVTNTSIIGDGVSSLIKATVLDYTNSNPLAVRLTDTDGNYIAAGAGTQYADGAVRGTATGTLLMVDDGVNIQSVAGTSAGLLKIDLSGTAANATAIKVDGSAVTQPVSGTVTANLGTIADVATQTTLALIKSKTDNIPILGQALEAASVPVVLTATQLTTLTPPAAITGFATAAKQDTGNSSLSTIAGAISGTEMQVDVVTMPTTTVQATNLDIRDLTSSDVVTVTGGVGQVSDVKVTLDSEAVVLGTGSAAIGKLLPSDIDVTTNTNHADKYYTNAGAVTDGIIWSPAAGKRWHITTLYVNVSAAATVTIEDDLAGGDVVRWKGEIAANSGVVIPYGTDHPMASGEDAADLIITTSAGNVYVQAVGYEI